MLENAQASGQALSTSLHQKSPQCSADSTSAQSTPVVRCEDAGDVGRDWRWRMRAGRGLSVEVTP